MLVFTFFFLGGEDDILVCVNLYRDIIITRKRFLNRNVIYSEMEIVLVSDCNHCFGFRTLFGSSSLLVSSGVAV